MSIVEFPKKPVVLSEEGRQKLRTEVVELAHILNNQLGRIEGFSSLDEPLEYTAGDFYLMAKVLLLTRIEMDDRFSEIIQCLEGGTL